MPPAEKKTLEDVYQKKTPLQHVLLRPDTYIGSVEHQSTATWVHDGAGLVHRDVSVVPGLFKIFDEILVNAADNKVRDPSMSELRVEVKPEENVVRVWNNGEGIPIVIHKEEKVYIPELIFGNLLTSSNFDDEEKKVMNGFGAKLANIFSEMFIIETGDGKSEYRQVFTDNMSKKEEPIIKPAKLKGGWTCVTFFPDLVKFGMTHLDDDIVAVMRKRAYDMAGILGRTVKVSFNDQKLPIKTFEDYVDLYLGKKSEGTARVHLKANDRWEIVVACTEGEFRQMSFVNSICTTKGGTHVNYIVEQICKALVEKLNKKTKSTLRNFHVKNHLHVFINCMIENPAFDSQTKENMTTRVSDFGSRCPLPDDFLDKVAKCGVLEQLINLAQAKSTQLLKKTDGSKTSRISIPKLEDATLAGTKQSTECTLILTEGDSAKALAMAGLSVVGRDYYGVFPLRGKLLNVRDASNATISNNKEIQYLKQIIGLQHDTVRHLPSTGVSECMSAMQQAYEDTRRLRYGHVLIMTDQDHDGSHIKGLIINFFHQCHPSLLRLPSFIQVFVTPIVKAFKGREERTFYTMPEYQTWKTEQGDQAKLWKVKYYKGLGTSTRQDAIKYFQAINFHKKELVYEGVEAEDAIDMAFSKKRAADRKNWLGNFEPGTFLDHNASQLTFTDFVNKELILFSLADIERSIPNLMDGLKVTQRKILYSCFKKGGDEMKVVQLVGYVSQHAAYHHGEQSLNSTIIVMAQNYVGTNNINLLEPSGQFGTRLQGGGRDAASARYLHTGLARLTRTIFPESDDGLLEYLNDDGQSIQPSWYVPVIPMVLVNGAEGIGTGWSTSIPNFSPLDIIANLLRMLDGEPPEPMHPWYMGFTGNIEPVGDGGESYVVTGRYVVHEEDGMIEIFDLPLKKWTDDYKEFLREAVSSPNPQAASLIQDFVDNTTDTTIHFQLYVTPEQMQNLKAKGVAETLKLTSKISTTNMVLFTETGSIKKYANVTEILEAFFNVRKDFYCKRKASMLEAAARKMKMMDNKARFILAIVEGRLVLSKRKKEDVLADMDRMGFDRERPQPRRAHQTDGPEDEEVAAEGSFNYLLRMPMDHLTLEKVQELQDKLEEQRRLVAEIEGKGHEDMWREDLVKLRQEYQQFLQATLNETQGVPVESNAPQTRGRGGRRGGRGTNRGRGGARAGASDASRSQTSSGRGATAGRRGGRGRGRGRGRAGSSIGSGSQGATSGDGSLANRLDQFHIASGSSAPSQPTGQQPERQQLTSITEEDEVTSPLKPRPKRKRRVVLLDDTDDNEDSSGEAAKKPRHEAEELENSDDNESSAGNSDPDFMASAAEDSQSD